MRRNSTAQAIAELRELLGERLSVAQSVREQHGQDLTWSRGAAPDAVAFLETTPEAQAVVRIAERYGVAVIAYGTGTSLEGHISAPHGGISVDLSRMNRILEVNEEDLDVRVEAGVTRKALNEHLRDKGLFFPIDPGADASLGGMAATRASGTNAVRYGTMRENVLNLTAVMASGEIVRTGRRAKKSSAGYDLTRLLVGSEGTLGIITEVVLRLQAIPESILAGVVPFPSIEAACNTAILTIQSAIPVARIELVDALQIRGLQRLFAARVSRSSRTCSWSSTAPRPARPSRWSCSGESPKSIGAGPLAWAERQEDRNRLWQARHDSFYAAKAMMPGKDAFATDVCVPISRLAECVVETQEDMAAHGIFGPIIGHVGDGNFHVQLFCDVADNAEVKRCEAFSERLVVRALAMEGTCTGEHGVGLGKRKFMAAEHGPGLAVMRAIKAALDPKGILNPGKILPAEAAQ